MANIQPQLTLVTDAIAAAMENTLVASKLFKWGGIEKGDPTNKLSFVERAPPRFNTVEWTDTVTDLTAGVQDRVNGAEVFSVNGGINLSFGYEDFARIRDEDSALRSDTLRAIGQNAGEAVDATILKHVIEQSNNWIGTPGTPIDTVAALIEGYVRLKEEGVPDGEIFAVLSYSDLPSLATYLLEDVTAASAKQASVLGTLGGKVKEIVGLKVLFTQQNPALTVGTASRSTTQLDWDPPTPHTYATVSQSLVSNGNYLTGRITLQGAGAATTVKVGEVFEINGVQAYDNRKHAALGRLQQFTVVADSADNADYNPATQTYTVSSGGAGVIRIFPALINAATGGVDRAHATIPTAPLDDAPIVFKGSVGTTYLQRAVIARSAARILSKDLEDLPSGETHRRKMKSVPLSLRGHKYSNGNTGQTRVRFDCAFKANTNTHGRWKVCRISGQS